MQASQQPALMATSSNLSALHANSVHSNSSSAGMPHVFQGNPVQAAGKENRSPDQPSDINLLAAADARGKLFQAAKTGDCEGLKVLLATPGHAIANCNAALIAAARKGHVDSVQTLLNHPGVRINARDEHGNTALIWAVRNAHTQAAGFLLEQATIEPMLANYAGLDALAAAAELGHPGMMRVVLGEQRIAAHACSNGCFAALRAAASMGNLPMLEQLWLSSGIDLNESDESCRNLLMMAAEKGNLELLRWLLRAPDIDVNTADAAGCTALMNAASNGQLDVMEALLQTPGIHVDRLDNDGHSALSHAARKGHEDSAALLISSRRVNPNRKIKKMSLLQWAATGRMPWFMQMLLDAGACFDPDPKVYADYLQANPFLKKDVIAVLDSYQKRRCKDGKQRYEVLHHTLYPCEPGFAIAESAASTTAAEQNPVPSLQQLALQKSCAAIISGNCTESAVADCLLYPAQMPAWHIPALTNAAALAFIAGHYRNPKKEHYLHPKIARAMTENMGKTFKEAMVMFKMVRHGSNRHEKDGYTPLTWAAERGDIDMIDLLLALGANIDLLDSYGSHALRAASSAAQWQAYEHLVRRNASPASFIEDGVTSWQDALYACQSESAEGEEAANALMAALAVDVNLVNRHEQTAVILAAKWDMPELLERLRTLPGVDMNFKDNRKASALIWAAHSGKTEAIRVLLLDDRVDINVERPYVNDGAVSGDTPLILAAYKGHLAIVRMLLRAPGIRINARNKAFDQNRPYLEQAHQVPHETALMHAAKFGHIDIVEELLAASGIDPFIQNHAGEDAAQLAKAAGHHAIAKRLAAFAARH